MPRKATSKKAAAAASKTLANPTSPKTANTSALIQREKRSPKKR